MAQGDAIAEIQETQGGSTLSIQPGSGTEWTIHNVYHGTDATLEITDGSISSEVDSISGSGCWAAQTWHLTNNHYLNLTLNASSTTSALTGYDGVVTNVL